MKKIQATYYFIFIAIAFISCAKVIPIKRLSESQSKFNNPSEVMKNDYPQKDIYRIYQRAGTGFVPINSVRKDIEERIEKFASKQDKSYEILGERTSKPPYILGNYPRIEIVFALISKSSNIDATIPKRDKYADLEKLKKTA